MQIGRAVDASALLAQAKTAGLALDSLWTDDDEVGTHDEHGLPVDIPTQIQAGLRAVIAAYVPPPPILVPDYGTDAADIDRQGADAVAALRAFIALTPPTQAQVVANAKLQNRVLLALLRRLAP